jgi:hypothetical protein
MARVEKVCSGSPVVVESLEALHWVSVNSLWAYVMEAKVVSVRLNDGQRLLQSFSMAETLVTDVADCVL